MLFEQHPAGFGGAVQCVGLGRARCSR
jgi:hypothetical protein